MSDAIISRGESAVHDDEIDYEALVARGVEMIEADPAITEGALTRALAAWADVATQDTACAACSAFATLAERGRPSGRLRRPGGAPRRVPGPKSAPGRVLRAP